MRIKIVDAANITTQTLRASDYVYHPKTRAEELVQQWLDDMGLRGFIHTNGTPMKELQKRIQQELERALDEGEHHG